MVQINPNERLFSLKLEKYGNDIVQVVSMAGKAEISNLFEYRFQLISTKSDLDSSKILNKKATFVMYRGNGKPVEIHGIISGFQQLGKSPDFFAYTAVLVPRLYRLKLNYRSEVYQHMMITDIVGQVMKDSGFSSSDFSFHLNGSYDKSDYWVQYRETNLDFVSRRLEHLGIAFYFDFSSGSDVVVFTDHMGSYPGIGKPQTIRYNPLNDHLFDEQTVFSFNSDEQLVSSEIELKDYNYQHPNNLPTGASKVDATGVGKFYEYGDNFPADAQGKSLAKIRSEEQKTLSTRFTGITDCRRMLAGQKWSLDNHYRDDWNRDYVVTAIRMKGHQSGLFPLMMQNNNEPDFHCEFDSIPTTISFRPERKTPIPRVPGIMSSTIESDGSDEYAYIDNQGHYRVKLHFDRSNTKDGEASLPVRLASPYAGTNYGLHFPNHAGTELIWGCVNGDVDRPIGIGTVPNPSTISPVVAKNKKQNVIRTMGKNELTFGDSKGNEFIYLKGTKDWKIEIANDKAQTVGANESATVGKNRQREVGNDESISIGNNRSKSIAKDESESIGENKNISVGKDHNESIGDNASINIGKDLTESIGDNLTLSIGADSHVSIDNNHASAIGGNSSHSVTKNLLVAVDKAATISVKDKLQIVSDKEILLKTGQASIHMKQNGDIIIKGGKITIKGSKDVVVKGSKIAGN